MTVRVVESGSDLPVGLCETHVESFLLHLRATGYAERTVRKKRCVAVSFAEWTQRERVRIEDLNDSHVSAFLKFLAQRQETRVSFSLAVLRLFMEQLREANDVPSVGCQRSVQNQPPMVDSKPASFVLVYLGVLHNAKGLGGGVIHGRRVGALPGPGWCGGG